MKTLNVALIGCGGIVLANHMPGLSLCPNVRVNALCDTNEQVLREAVQKTGAPVSATAYQEIVQRDDVDAVIIATPNVFHAPIAHAAIQAGKHVLCEKPIAMSLAEARQMLVAAEKAGVRHMTAFTYRFVPAMRYMAHLVQSGAIGEPYHIRTCRLQDWGTRSIAWRQTAALAGSGELGDMLSHRIDYAHLLLGEISELVADMRRFHDVRGGLKNDLDDWIALLARFAKNNATGVLESSKHATGRGEGGKSPDYCEVNGSEGTLVYFLDKPHELQVASNKEPGLKVVPLPREFLTWPGSPRDPLAGDPLVTFRYDQNVEFIQAIRDQRPCVPSFLDGVKVQAVMEAAQVSVKEKRWVQLASEAAR